MKGLKLSLIVLAATLLAFGLSGMAYAFHSGGVADCAGCHSMHSSAGPNLLINSDASSTCLSCHENANDTGPSSYHVSTAEAKLTSGTAPLQRGPGGDFAWLKKSYAWTAHGEAETEDGQLHGHNIIAADFNYQVDTRNSQAPGGTFSSSQLGCASCHDPHGSGKRFPDGTYGTAASNPGFPTTGSGSTGNVPPAGQAYGTYRILAGPYYAGAAGVTFKGWPIAVSPSSYNRTEAATMTRIAYGAQAANTWGNWCGSCHPAMASGGAGIGTSGHTHPVDDTLGSSTGTPGYNYNKYVMSGDLSGTFPATAPGPYSSLVPFAEATGDMTTLKSHAQTNNSQLGGPGSSDTVVCFSCHRGHASGWAHALRWNTEATFIVNNGAWPADMGRTSIETQGAYYDRPPTMFASYQRSLCNKCHAKD
jgi:predicted CXXCH cytochrome family protein